MPKGAANLEMSLKFIEFMMSNEVQKILSRGLGWPSFRPSVYTSVEPWMEPHIQAILKAMGNAEPRSHVSYWADLDKALTGAFREIVVEGKDVKEVLDKYHDVLERAITSD